jgi:hypothetical protein
MNDQMQEGFEMAYGFCWIDHAEVCKVWSIAWQASRAALVVDLPDEQDISASDSPWDMLSMCSIAVQLAGVSVK